ncbi:MAG: hypothetical protein K8Q97_00655 [Candidatus Andersenbacteria bacterium]|nr:hypothetical protein [Candidatus Andersenbacteria bacterium]
MPTELVSGQCYIADRLWARGVVVYRASLQDPREIHKEWVIWKGMTESCPLVGQRFWLVRDPPGKILHVVVFRGTSGHADELS